MNWGRLRDITFNGWEIVHERNSYRKVVAKHNIGKM